MIAVQGPNARAKVQSLLSAAVREKAAKIGKFVAVEGDGLFIARTGYTGEDGYEIIVPEAQAVDLWNKLIGAGVVPAGLGARDTLRLEAGMPLYGHEIDSEHNPIEAGLSFGVSFKPEKGDWIGRDALERIRKAPRRSLVGIVTDGPRVPRQGYELYQDDRRVGEVCSGAVSPTLVKNIGTAYLPLDLARPGTRVDMDMRGKRQTCEVVPLPFYSRTR
jgi:aminomethyltransferase